MTSSIAEQLAHLKQTFEVLQDYEGSSVFAETAALLASASTPHDLILVAEAIGDFARTGTRVDRSIARSIATWLTRSLAQCSGGSYALG